MATQDLTARAPSVAAAPHYDRAHRAFHWSMAAIVIAAMLIGLYCAYQAPGTPVRRFLLEWHKSLGMTALVLVVFRIAYRLARAAPPHAERMGRLTQAAAGGAHVGLYGLMLLLPTTGYAFSALGGYSLPFFWLFQWPRLLPVDRAAAPLAEDLHRYGAWAIYGVVGLHVAAVAWHQFVRRDGVLSRMWPRRR